MKPGGDRMEPMSAAKPSIIVTGGAGFIGSALCRFLIGGGHAMVINVDKMTYAANPASLAGVEGSADYHFRQADVCDGAALEGVFREFLPDGVIHLAAESHVDRSIAGARPFIETNVAGTYRLLEAARDHWSSLPEPRRSGFRFLHVSTDEVYGSLGETGSFTETSRYDPSSPYSASKAASDHLVSAWHRTYGLPVLTAHCTNNYGPCQHPEKLIPRMILRCLEHWPLPVFGAGRNVRDWLYVDDCARALWMIWNGGRTGESYGVGANDERRNIDVTRAICRLMDGLSPHPFPGGHESLIEFVTDRPGHDFRYAINPAKLEHETGWRAAVPFEVGLRETVRWYLENESRRE